MDIQEVHMVIPNSAIGQSIRRVLADTGVQQPVIVSSVLSSDAGAGIAVGLLRGPTRAVQSVLLRIEQATGMPVDRFVPENELHGVRTASGQATGGRGPVALRSDAAREPCQPQAGHVRPVGQMPGQPMQPVQQGRAAGPSAPSDGPGHANHCVCGFTELMLAARDGDLQLVRDMLRQPGVDIYLPADKREPRWVGWTAIQLAAQRGHVAVVRELLAHVRPPLSVDMRLPGSLRTLLAVLLYNAPDPQLVQELIMRGADVNAVDERGLSVLGVCVDLATRTTTVEKLAQYIDVAGTLIVHGANVHGFNLQDQSCVQMVEDAMRSGHVADRPSIVALLQRLKTKLTVAAGARPAGASDSQGSGEHAGAAHAQHGRAGHPGPVLAADSTGTGMLHLLEGLGLLGLDAVHSPAAQHAAWHRPW